MIERNRVSHYHTVNSTDVAFICLEVVLPVLYFYTAVIFFVLSENKLHMHTSPVALLHNARVVSSQWLWVV